MKKTLFFIAIGIVIALASFMVLNNSHASLKVLADGGKGWFPAGSSPKDYKMEITSAVHHSGSKSGMIQYIASGDPSGFGTFMQMHKPGAWTGKKVKMTAYIKTEDVTGWCGMWFRVDGPDKGASIDFDNMQDRPIKGTTDWTKYEITLNVQKEATAVAYGVLVGGKGTAYFDDVKFEIVGDAVPGESHEKDMMKSAPENLDFEN